jgi:branched-chain amino acid transport system substrate-binding protein
MTTTKRSGTKLVALSALAALVIAACGGSDSESSDTAAAEAPAASEAPAPAASEAPAESAAEPAAGGDGFVIAIEVPLQGASKDASEAAVNAAELALEQAGGKAGSYTITTKVYDNSTAAKGGWDDATCAKNAADHVAAANEIAVLGPYNSGCAKIIVPVLNQDETGPMLMISHANTNPGLTKTWDPGEPEIFYPTGTRNYGRMIATDDFQGAAGAQFAQKELGLTKCLVLDDGQTYGVGVATAFKTEAEALGIAVIDGGSWDAKQPNYTAIFEKAATDSPDCVYLGGINDNNGEQLIRDKVAVLGPNTGDVKLIAPDGFSGYPTVQALAEAQDMYITFAGLPTSELQKIDGPAADFVNAYIEKYGEPASFYAWYAAAAMQFLIETIAASDGTRADVTAKAFSGITVSADKSVIGKEFGIDENGDVTIKDMSINVLTGNAETYLKPWPLG